MKKIFVDLKELVASPVGTKETIEIKTEIPSPDQDNIFIKSPLLGKIKFTNLEKEILSEFDLKIKISLFCSRCGEKFSKKIDLKAKKTYKALCAESAECPPSGSYISARTHRYKLSELTKNQKLDILPGINEEIILTIPIKPLCQEKCQGLCQNCGQNLNSKKCSCEDQIKPINKNKPFANLKKLLESPDACSRDSDKNVGGENRG